jgi:hypothetical protein
MSRQNKRVGSSNAIDSFLTYCIDMLTFCSLMYAKICSLLMSKEHRENALCSLVVGS